MGRLTAILMTAIVGLLFLGGCSGQPFSHANGTDPFGAASGASMGGSGGGY